MTQTPRTDVAEAGCGQGMVKGSFARQLELETNKLRNAGTLMLRCLERAGTTDCACSSVQAYKEKELAIAAWKEVTK